MVMEIPLTKGYISIVDDADYERVMAAGSWCALVTPGKDAVYARKAIRKPDGRTTSTSLHRFITGWSYVDHINRDGLDNRRENLRPATRSQNAGNQRVRRDTKIGYKGVTRNSIGRWRARLGTNPILNIGTFLTAEDAARAYDAAAVERWGEYARVNFPNDSDEQRQDAIANSSRVHVSPTGFIGVHHYRNGRYRADIWAHGRGRYIGYFDTADEAAAAYDAAAFDLFGANPPHLNFPQEQSA